MYGPDVRALIIILALAACSEPPRQHPVGQLQGRIECTWDQYDYAYKLHIVYREASGEVTGQSAPAGDCDPNARTEAQTVYAPGSAPTDAVRP